jgi:phospholipase A1/A2
MFRSCLFLAVAAASPFAVAASLADCRTLADAGARLACYDALAFASAPATATASLGGHEGGLTAPPLPALAATPPVALSDASTPLARAWELDPDSRGRILRIRAYRPVYLLPLFYSSAPNDMPSSPSPGHTSDSQSLNHTEAKLQISLKTKLAEDLFGNNGDLWFGYTQSSRWQVYNSGDSRPFRETNHEPEAMLVFRTDYELAGWRGRLFNLSLNHQSNGRSLPLSRSWNRVMLSADFERNDWTLSIRPWWRISEATSQDDNPDISNYLGRGDIHLVRTWGDRQLSLLARHSLRGGENSHGALQLDYAFPIAGDLRGHLQWFSGYGESMIDYNHRANYFGLGVSLLEWY